DGARQNRCQARGDYPRTPEPPFDDGAASEPALLKKHNLIPPDNAQERHLDPRPEGRIDQRTARDSGRRGHAPPNEACTRAGETLLVQVSQADVVVNLLIFLMATFLGTELIRHVARLLHTPLMSLTNAISSVSIVAALIVMVGPKNDFILTLVTVAVALAATNIVSGFMITDRILRLFRRRQRK